MTHQDPGVPTGAGESAQQAYTEQELEAALREVPKGALALAGLTVGLLVLAWLAMYAFVFLPRGMVG